jgi:hypothetical protein
MSGYGYGYGYSGPGDFDYSLTSRSLKENPEVLQDWARPHFNLRKSALVSREIERIAKERNLGDRWFKAIGFDMQQSMAKAYPKTKYPQGDEGETTNDDIELGMKRISKYIQGEKNRFDATKQGILPDEHWNRQLETAKQMEEEWNQLKDVIEEEIQSPPIKAAIAPLMRADYLLSQKSSKPNKGGKRNVSNKHGKSGKRTFNNKRNKSVKRRNKKSKRSKGGKRSITRRRN